MKQAPAPQDFGRKAMEYTSERLLGRAVVVQPLPGKVDGPWYDPKIRLYDRYGRIQAFVSVEGEDGGSFNEELLRKGMAWWYNPFVPFERGFKRIEDQARKAKVGLWSDPNAMPPWYWQGTVIGRANPWQTKKGVAILVFMSIAGAAAVAMVLLIVVFVLKRLFRLCFRTSRRLGTKPRVG
jgi:hypothetical protein